jgi:hypothetical protein
MTKKRGKRTLTLGGDGFGADAGFGERHILWNARVEVMAHHQLHVKNEANMIHED